MTVVEEFHRKCAGGADVRGFLHRPDQATGDGLVIAHGAGGDARGATLVAICEAFAEAGYAALRIDLPFRQAGGSPRPATAARDQAGIRNAVAALRAIAGGRIVLGGHSYGGRQASMLVAGDASVCDHLLLCSYPLHPPGQPQKLRTEHLPKIAVPVTFIHGTKDPFGSPEEMQAAVKLVPRAKIVWVERAGHDLGRDRRAIAVLAVQNVTRA
jgi:predicted alpha/beta-hydrolase family hydrolase